MSRYIVSKMTILFFTVILILLSVITYHNYLLFHIYVEGFSIVVAVMIFILTWNSRKYLKNNFFLIIGMSYLFVANLDMLHTISYKGMNVFKDYSYYANQLWVASRFLEALSLFAGCLFIRKTKKVNVNLVLGIMLFYTVTMLISIFTFRNFPECFISGEGQTLFKVISEYVIISILGVSVYLLKINREHFEKKLFIYLTLSIFFTMISELFFTFYIRNYGISNILGHYFKIFSFIFIYQSIVETAIQKPYDIIFRELQKSRDEISRLYQSKQKIYSIIGHDLRTPFNGLIGLSDMLCTDYDNLSHDEIKEYVTSINKVSKDTYRLLENLLDWSKYDTSLYEPEKKRLDLTGVIKDICKSFKEISRNKNIKLIYENVENELSIEADEKMIYAVIRNLLSNSIKFSEEGGEVYAEAYRKASDVIVKIKDSGIGMDKEELSKLFTNDKVVKKGTDDEKGSGLGTGMIKEFTEKNNGSISVKSNKGKGTEFVLKFPEI